MDLRKSPKNALPVSLYTKEKPKKNHCIVTIANVIELKYSIDKAFLRRRKPE